LSPGLEERVKGFVTGTFDVETEPFVETLAMLPRALAKTLKAERLAVAHGGSDRVVPTKALKTSPQFHLQ